MAHLSHEQEARASDRGGRTASASPEQRLRRDLRDHFLEYARERPDVVALCCFSLGFVLGWKLKPW